MLINARWGHTSVIKMPNVLTQIHHTHANATLDTLETDSRVMVSHLFLTFSHILHLY